MECESEIVRKSVFEELEGIYRKESNYLIPNIKLQD